MLIETFRNLFSREAKNTIPDKDNVLVIAAGVLMLEIARADDEIDLFEEKVVLEGIKKFLLESDGDVEETYKRILEVGEESVSLYEFTSLINQEFSKIEKYGLLVLLWRIAYADGRLDKYEEYYIRKIKDLLYLSHNDFIRAKLEFSSSA